MKTAACWTLLALVLMAGAAHARDGWEGRPRVCDMSPGPRLERCQTWISTVQRPDLRGASCCGEGDAFIADNYRIDKATGDLYAIVSLDYFDQEGNLVYYATQEVLIPREKQNFLPEDAGNTSGHGVFFASGPNIYCWFAPPLT